MIKRRAQEKEEDVHFISETERNIGNGMHPAGRMSKE
jgi:hypothetical protein